MDPVIQSLLDEVGITRADLFKDLDENDREIALQVLRDWQEGQPSNTLVKLWERDYSHRPVPPQIFFENEYYFPEPGSLHDKWKDELAYVLDPTNGIVEWCLTGGIGTGKTTAAAAGQTYKKYNLSCMKNPQAFYGLRPEATIVFAIFNVTKDKAAGRAMSYMKGMHEGSLYFRENFPSLKKDCSVFPKNIAIVLGSQALHAIGEDVHSGILDEISWVSKGGDEERAAPYNLYLNVRRRMESRFIEAGSVYGNLPGLLCIISSKKSSQEFIEKHIREYSGTPGVHISDFTQWEVNPVKFIDMGRFRVEIGDSYHATRVLQDGEKAREGSKVVEVPQVFHDAFEKDPEGSARDLAGVATYSQQPLLRRREKLKDCLDLSLFHPFTKEFLTVDFDVETKIQDFFMLEKLCRRHMGTFVPRLHPESPRYIHVDLGVKCDAAGIAMVHSASRESRTTAMPDGSVSTSYAPIYTFDFMLQVKAQKGSEIDIGMFRDFIVFLQKAGYQIRKITYDSYQSTGSIQELRRHFRSKVDSKGGSKKHMVDLQSVDRDDIAYVTMRDAFMDTRVRMYDYPIFTEELVNLNHDLDKHKVDHPLDGSKDVSDAACGAIENCLEDLSSDAVATRPPVEAPNDYRRTPETVKSDWILPPYAGPGKIKPNQIKQPLVFVGPSRAPKVN